jgi:hypothetical protein
MSVCATVLLAIVAIFLVAVIIEWAALAIGVVISAIRYQIRSGKERAIINGFIKDLSIEINELEPISH